MNMITVNNHQIEMYILLDDCLQLVCAPEHDFYLPGGTDIFHRCRVCKWGRLAEKWKCRNCLMNVHERCICRAPLPCTYATPILFINSPDLKDCTRKLPTHLVRVPALLIKCFYELQKRDRIRTPNLYHLEKFNDKMRKIVQKVSRKMRRAANRDLSSVPTEAIVACVLDFLTDIKDQLLNDADIADFKAIEADIPNVSDTTTGQRLKEKLAELPVESQQTLAVLILHLRQVADENPSYRGNLDILVPFFPIIEVIDLLFAVSHMVWGDIVRSTQDELSLTARP